MNFADVIKGFSAGGSKVDAALALAEGLWEAGKMVFEIVQAGNEADEAAALARLDAQLEKNAPLATGLRALIAANRTQALQDLEKKFRAPAAEEPTKP